MLHTSAVVYALIASAVLLGTAAPLANALDATPAPQERPGQPSQPESGPGGSERAFPAARAVKYGPDPGGFWIWEPTTAEGDAPTEGPFPIVFYLSGCCLDDTWPTPEEVDPWLTHLARQGYVIVAPVYRRTSALADAVPLMKDALRELEFPGHASIDPARSAMIGFSFGGLLATMLAALAAEEGLPVPQALFLSAPCTENGWCLDMPDETPILPKGLKATIIAYDDDFDIGDAPKLVWEALASLPDDDRDFVMMRTDSHGRPVLWARHETTYQEVDAADWYGVWKLSDALLACAFFGEWCEYALGNTPEQRFMGVWSDGIAVKELVVTDDPAEIS